MVFIRSIISIGIVIMMCGCSKKDLPATTENKTNTTLPAALPPVAGATTLPGALEIPALKANLEGALAIGVGEYDGVSLNLGSFSINFNFLDATKSKKLVKITSEGKVVNIDLPKAAVVNDNETMPNISKVIGLSEYGVALVLEQPSYKHCTNIIWIKKDGSIVPLGAQFGTQAAWGCSQAFNATEVSYTTDGKVWALGYISGSGVFKFDLASSTAVRVTDEQQNINYFRATADGSVFISGTLIATNASFSRRIKPNNGFENFSVSNFWASGVAGNSFIDGGTVWEVKNGSLTRVKLPIDVTSANVSGQNGFRTINNSWFLSTGSGTALNVATDGDRPASSSVLSTARQISPGMFFDGSNLSKLVFTAEGLKAKQYATLRYENAGSDFVTNVYGQHHGLASGTYQMLTRSGIGTSIGSMDVVLDAATSTIQVPLSEAFSLGFTGGTFIPGTAFRHDGTLFVVNNQNFSLFEADLTLPSQIGTLETVTPSVTFNGYNEAITFADKAYYSIGTNAQICSFDMLLKQNSCVNYLDGSETVVSVNADRSGKPVVVSKVGVTPNEQICMSWFSTWILASYDSRICTTAFSASDSYGGYARYFAAFAENENDPMHEYLLLENSAKLVPVKSDRSGFDTSVSISSIPTTGYFLFGQSMSAREIVAPWTNEDFLLSGIKNSQYRSYRVSTVTRQESRIAELDGIQIYSAGVTSAQEMIVNGLRVDDNIRVTIRFSADGTLIGEDAESNVKILDIIPFSNN